MLEIKSFLDQRLLNVTPNETYAVSVNNGLGLKYIYNFMRVPIHKRVRLTMSVIHLF